MLAAALFLREETVEEIKAQTLQLARALNVVGLMNTQFAVREEDGKFQIYILEVNPRASRTVPFVAKATGAAHRQDRRPADGWRKAG